LESGLQKPVIDSYFIWVADETRTNISIVTESRDHYIKINEKGPFVDEARQKELLDKLDRLRSREIGGFWQSACIGDDFYTHVVNRLADRGAQAILDTNGDYLRLGCGANPYFDLGAQNVVISMGKAGALLDNTACTWLAWALIDDAGIRFAGGNWMGRCKRSSNSQWMVRR
jgi:fructose-1-phosphate kinase PfkB-like protein